MRARAKRWTHPSGPLGLRVHRAQRQWETLAVRADLPLVCDARRCAKLAKSRKQAHRIERRLVRQLLRDSIAA